MSQDPPKLRLSRFAASVKAETAFSVLATAKRLIENGKEVYELEIGDSPFETPLQAARAGVDAIQNGETHYASSSGLASFRRAAADYVRREFDLQVGEEHILVGHGAKIFQQLFCELFLNPGDAVLVFEPYFPTYPANIQRRGGRMIAKPLLESRQFRPDPSCVADFIENESNARAIFLNSPHNPTGGVTTVEDLEAIASLVRDTSIMVLSDEPYDQMVWSGRHHTLLEQPGMMRNVVACYSFSKSFSMSGWRLGFAVADPEIIDSMTTLINTSLSCVPPFVQRAGAAALRDERGYRDQMMEVFRLNVRSLVEELNQIEEIDTQFPGGSFYAFPNVTRVCHRLGMTSHGLAMFLLEGADDETGVACLGGECFGDAGQGFLRLSCAESKDRLVEAVRFVGKAILREDRARAYLNEHPEYRSEPTA